MSKPHDYLTPDAAAEIIGIEVSGVRRYCRLGRLTAKKFARDWLILRRDAERFAPEKPGRRKNSRNNP